MQLRMLIRHDDAFFDIDIFDADAAFALILLLTLRRCFHTPLRCYAHYFFRAAIRHCLPRRCHAIADATAILLLL